MRILTRIAVPLLLLSTLVLGTFAPGTAIAAGKRWVCVPCGLPCDAGTFDAPGTCPKCGMALVEEGSAAATPDPARKKVAILLFDGVEIVDSMGPYEMFGAANCDVYTVAKSKDAVTSAMGQTMVPKYAFDDAPAPDVLVVPGGGVRAAAADAPTLDYVKRVTARDQQTMSVCNGAFILASAGLLDGHTATTTNGNIDRLAKAYPKIHVVRDQRFVDNGHIVTAAGLSAGMDGALHVIAKLFGEGVAQQVALGEEYDWHADGRFARASFADTQIPDLKLDGLGRWDVLRTQGTTTRWEIAIAGRCDLSAAELMERLAKALESDGAWKPRPAAATAGRAQVRQWTFTGRDGHPWTGTLSIEDAPGDARPRRLEMRVARAS